MLADVWHDVGGRGRLQKPYRQRLAASYPIPPDASSVEGFIINPGKAYRFAERTNVV